MEKLFMTMMIHKAYIMGKLHIFIDINSYWLRICEVKCSTFKQ